MDIEILPDGTERHLYDPLRDVPFYSDWLRFLLKHGAAYTVRKACSCGGDPDCGRCEGTISYLDIEPLHSSLQEQAAIVNADSTVGILCICCGTPARKLDMNKIRIGGYVQFKEDIPIPDTDIIESKWRRKPIAKSGLGCKACQILYVAEEQLAERENAVRRRDALLEAKMIGNEQQIYALRNPPSMAPIGKCTHGLDARFCAVCLKHSPAKRTKIEARLAGLVVPWINVFSGDFEQ